MLYVILIIIFLVIIKNYFINNENFEYMVNIPRIDTPVRWKRDKTCKYMMNKTLKNVLDDNNINQTDSDDWAFYFPCTYNHIKQEINNVSTRNNNQRLFIVNNADQLTSKNNIWKNLVKVYGREEARHLMPTTYILSNHTDMELFNKEHSPKKLYILKKNIQRQKGIKLTNKKTEILNSINDNYVVVQELLQNPYLINGRKINMRFYLLFVCQNNEVSAYVHRNGFMYYTRDPFVKNSLEDGPNITTGYIDRVVYDVNPLTHDDFRNYLDKHRKLSGAEMDILNNNRRISEVVFYRIYDLLRKTVIAVKHTVCNNSHIKRNISFQLFGADIAVSDKLIPQLIEVNKGPDMSYKDKRDGKVKYGVMTDIFKVLKAINNKDHGFIEIYNDD